uniref:Verprolin n=1 Tax=Coccidioides posadasii RMSCC 3488 TaxID=454284 RepID=A0A0J6F723_COCPO|nr:verprolin [Coccidioides posadasii RMSCC 3488]
MALTFNSSTRPSLSRQVRAEGSLNTIMEDSQEARGNYIGRSLHRIITDGQSHRQRYDNSSRAKAKIHPRGAGAHGSSPLAQHGDGNRFSISSSRRASCSTDCRARHRDHFDDLYDATDESDRESCPSLSSQAETGSNSSFTVSDASSISKDSRRRTFPTLYIPSSKVGAKSSPLPPTPPPKIPVSPLALAKLPQNVPKIAAPPSLAGSASEVSDRPSTFSTPQTPDLADVPDVNWGEQRLRVRGNLESGHPSRSASASASPRLDVQLDAPEDWSAFLGNFPRIPAHAVEDGSSSVCESDAAPSVESNRGLQLPVAALAALQRFEVNSDRFQSRPPSEVGEAKEMHELLSHMRYKDPGDPLSASAYSGSSFTSLSVPSPGGFFASLKGQARKTWCFSSANTPTSAMAEKFYDLPWDPQGNTIVEQVVECPDDGTEGPPTAKALVSGPPTARKIPAEFAEEAQREGVRDGPDNNNNANNDNDYDATYAKALKAHSMSTLDRTTLWLATQSAYLTGIEDKRLNGAVQESLGSAASGKVGETKPTADHIDSTKYSERSTKLLSEPPSKPLPTKEPTFYLGFKHVQQTSQNADAFLHSNFRFEAMQAARLSMPAKHVDHVAGKYELNNPVRPPYRGPFAQAPRNSKLTSVLQEQVMFSNVEKEQDALVQLRASAWAIEALKFLNGGPLVPSPAAKRMAEAAPPGQPGTPGKRRVKALDLGGQSACEWGWHLANEYPNVEVFTAVTKDQAVSPVEAPPNYQHIPVPCLWKLPFKDNQFDLISARSLHMLLKSSRPVGARDDEVDMCLKECLRCLKPGGYLEFFLMDSEIVRAGTYGSATSVEFGFNLKTRGYDPAPTKAFLSRLRKANFGDLKRAWLFLPMGAPYNEHAQVPGIKTPSSPDTAELMGSTADIASTSGLFGGWMWEQWMLKLQMEMGRDNHKLLDETAAVIDEGRKCGAGWRCLSGWAMKPKKKQTS